jgi:hypothetical protein
MTHRPWWTTRLLYRLGCAWRAFQGDHWQDPAYVAETEQMMAAGALAAIDEKLDRIGIPKGTFADDQVHNLIAMWLERGREIEQMRELVE